MIMCVLLCYPVSIRIYYQQGGLLLVNTCVTILRNIVNWPPFITLEASATSPEDNM